jgi:hypothetical protein
MGCFFALFAGLFPRLALFIVWVARPKMVDAAFDTWILPLLGIIFLPFATLIYVILYTVGTGLSGSDWFWVGLAAVLDIVHWGAGWTQRRQAPGYPSSVQA